MGVHDVLTAFNTSYPATPAQTVTMDYLDGGRRELYRFQFGAGRAIQIVWEGGQSIGDICRKAFDEYNQVPIAAVPIDPRGSA